MSVETPETQSGGSWFRGTVFAGEVTATFAVTAADKETAFEHLHDYRTDPANRKLCLEPSDDDIEPYIEPATPQDVARFALFTLGNHPNTAVWLQDYRCPPIEITPPQNP